MTNSPRRGKHEENDPSAQKAAARAADTPTFLAELIQRWRGVQTQRTVHPLIALGAFNLDFLCIHPFRDGNGRVSRLLFLLPFY